MNRVSIRRLLCALVASLLVALTPALVPSGTGIKPAAFAMEQASHAALREGDRGEAVAQMQRALSALGYLSGSPDGVYGPDTQAAVAAFQADRLPDESAYATPRTLELLYESVTVFIAPYSGERYHVDPACWGFENARSVESVTLASALEQGMTPCKICCEEAP